MVDDRDSGVLSSDEVFDLLQGLQMGHNGSKGAPTPMPGNEDGSEKDLEDLAASLEVDKSNVCDDEDLGGGPILTGKKRKAGTRGPARENGSVAKRVLRSDSKLRAVA